MTAKRRRIATHILIVTGGCVALLLLASRYVRLNTTPSVPRGLYLLTDKAHGTYVTLCPGGPDAQLMNQRGYRPRGTGCRDGFAPLVKPIAAEVGDVVTVDDRGISVNGELLAHTTARRQDSLHRPLPSVAHGTYPVQAGTIWVVSTYNENSFDSRYLGAVPVERIISYARPIWTF